MLLSDGTLKWFIDMQWAILIGRLIWISGIILYVFDYSIVVSVETTAVWSRKLSKVSFLLLTSRYMYLLYTILSFLSLIYPNFSYKMGGVGEVFLIVSYPTSLLTLRTISAMRAYALWGFSKAILGLLLVFLLADSITNIGYAVISLNQRFETLSFPIFVAGWYLDVASIGTGIVFNGLVFILTISRTAVMVRRARASGLQHTFSSLLLRDGSLYFGITLAHDVLFLIYYMIVLRPLQSSPSQISGPIAAETEGGLSILDTLETVLIQRLVLNLRMYSQNENATSCRSMSEISFCAAYGRSPSTEIPSQSVLASFMAAEELGGLLGPLGEDEGHNNCLSGHHQTDVLEAELESDGDNKATGPFSTTSRP